MKKNIVIVLSLLLCSQNLIAQTTRLKIGDKVPDIEFKLINSEREIVKLSDYKGKLVVLDFWATWCGPCKNSLYKCDSLKKKYGNKVEIIAVNSINRPKADTREKVCIFYNKWMERFPKFPLPIAVEDTLAFLLFPHIGVPNFVIITQDGTVGAIIGARDLTVDNIEKFLCGQKPSLPIKDDWLKMIKN